MTLKYVIFTFENAPDERKTNVQKLKNELNAEIFVGGKNTIKNLIDLCNAYKNDDIIMIEDDIELCNNFIEITNNIINENNNKIINFHYNNVANNIVDEKTISNKNITIHELDGINYIWNQCVYIPSKYLKTILRKFNDFIRHYNYYVKTNQHDIMISEAIKNDTFLCVKPSLVKSLDYDSTIHEGIRRTIDFIDN